MLFPYTRRFLKHRFRARSRHGTHSPFVYHLVDKVIYDFSKEKVYVLLEAERKKLWRDDKYVWSGGRRNDQLMFRLARFHEPKAVFLFGQALRMSCQYLMHARPEAMFQVFDAREGLALAPLALPLPALDFVLVQGVYTQAEVLKVFSRCLPHFYPGSLLILEGIYKNKDMMAAWETIKVHPQVSITVDLFSLGLVYFREGQVKEHFKIKF